MNIFHLRRKISQSENLSSPINQAGRDHAGNTIPAGVFTPGDRIPAGVFAPVDDSTRYHGGDDTDAILAERRRAMLDAEFDNKVQEEIEGDEEVIALKDRLQTRIQTLSEEKEATRESYRFVADEREL